MNEFLFQIFIGAIIFIYFIWRFIYSPKFTHMALQKFIIDSLRKKKFEDFKVSLSERIKVNNRTAFAHWKSHIGIDKPEIIVAFYVHPSTFPMSIKSSAFIHIRDKKHFDSIQKALQNSEDYTPFMANDETMEKVLSS